MTFFSWTSRWSITWQSLWQKLWTKHSFFDEIAWHEECLTMRCRQRQTTFQIGIPWPNSAKQNYPRKVFRIFFKWTRKFDFVQGFRFSVNVDEKNRWKESTSNRITRLIAYFEAPCYLMSRFKNRLSLIDIEIILKNKEDEKSWKKLNHHNVHHHGLIESEKLTSLTSF